MRCGPAPAADSSWWVDHYEAHIESIKCKAKCDKEDAEKAEAKARELAAPKPKTMAQAAYEQLPPELQKIFTLELFTARLQAIDQSSEEAWLDLRDDLQDELDGQEILQAAYGHGPSMAAGAALVKIVTARQERKRLAREAKETPSPSQIKIVAAAATVLPALPLHQDGNPQHQKLYHEREWREATGDKAKRLGSSTSMSQSAFETEGGATRKDLKEAERDLKGLKPAPKKDSS